MKKRIGISGWKLGDNSFGITLPYLEFISQFGRPYILSPEDAGSPPDLDLLILPGGADINPLSYGDKPNYRTNAPNLILEYFDKEILPFYLENQTPIFGICRGMQRLFNLFGGKIIQHNPYHKQSSHNNDECHELAFTPKYKAFENYVHRVTSRHHQTCDGSGYVPEEIEIIAYSNERYKDGNTYKDNINKSIVEIFKHKNNLIYGVQYHPEDNITETLSTLIVTELLGE